VTGASSGIGRATALRFAQEGWNVCVTARREQRLAELVRLFPSGRHLICPGDYSDPALAESIRAQIASEWGGVDVLANCAGIYTVTHPVETPLADWREAFDTMVNGALYLTRMAVPFMTSGGRVIQVTSVQGERAVVGASSYSMAKAALNQLSRALAVELATKGILVNVVAPGFVATEMSVVDGVNELEGEWFKQYYVEGHFLPLQRAGLPEEIAGVIYFLAGPDASYITGQVINVDGGLTITI
jgi:3-oxoacyl-[acyl-carrier protein] reductase